MRQEGGRAEEQSCGAPASLSLAPAAKGGRSWCESKIEKVTYANSNPTIPFLRSAVVGIDGDGGASGGLAVGLGMMVHVCMEAGYR